jgi:hypothetical protein
MKSGFDILQKPIRQQRSHLAGPIRSQKKIRCSWVPSTALHCAHQFATSIQILKSSQSTRRSTFPRKLKRSASCRRNSQPSSPRDALAHHHQPMRHHYIAESCSHNIRVTPRIVRNQGRFGSTKALQRVWSESFILPYSVHIACEVSAAGAPAANSPSVTKLPPRVHVSRAEVQVLEQSSYLKSGSVCTPSF